MKGRSSSLKDKLTPYNCLLKSANFLIKITNEKAFPDIKFTGVWDSVNCFSVWFCENYLLVLEIRFQVFYLTSKKIQGFSSDKKILLMQSLLFDPVEPCLSFFEISIFSWDFLGNWTSCVWNQLHFHTKSDKSFCRWKTTKDERFPQIYLISYLPFKASAFFQIFFPNKTSFKFCTTRWM